MATASDDFNRADGAIGASWVNVGDTSNVVIVSNKAQSANSADAGEAHAAWATPFTAGGPLFSQATFRSPALSNVSAVIELDNDPSGGLGTFGGTFMKWTSDGVVILRQYHGGGTTFDTQSKTMVAATDYVLRVESTSAGVVTGYIDGVAIVTHDFGAALSERYPGFAVRGDLTADTWTGGDVSGTPAAPGQVTGLTAVSGFGVANLAWTAPSANFSAITDYLIERAPDVAGSAGTYATVSHAAQTTTSYVDATVSAGSVYWYRVSAINAIGTGTASSAASVTVGRFPHISASNSIGGTSLGAARAVTKPTSTTGDLVLVVVGHDQPSTTVITAATGWTAVGSPLTQGTNVIKCAWFGRVLDGGANDALTISGAAQDYVIACLVIPAAEHRYTNATIGSIPAAGIVSSANGNGDPPSLTPAGGSDDYLWIVSDLVDQSATQSITAMPASFTQATNQTSSAGSTTAVILATAWRQLTGSTLDPGAFANPARPWVAYTLAIQPPAVATTPLAGSWGIPSGV